MSALKEFSKSLNESPWPFFKQTFPVKVRQVDKGFLMINQALKEDILEEGDCLQRRSAAKCLMTRWNMHENSEDSAAYESFRMVGNTAIRLANDFPLATKSKQDGTPEEIPLYLKETWGLIYNKGDSTEAHMHWPSLWSYTYCVEACELCSPLVFPTCNEPEEKLEIAPRIGQMVLWPAWVMHEVPEHTCDHDRIMISGNLNLK